MPRRGAWLAAAEIRLTAAGLEAPRAEAEALWRAFGPEAAATTGLAAALARRATREPLARIAGHRAFWTLDLKLSPATLEPRPDSETLVETALARFPDPTSPGRVLDLGTGTGCLLLSVLAERPAWWGLGVDRAPEAVRTARANAVAHGLAPRAAFMVADWAAPLAGRFDLILSNPPYIPAGDLAALQPEVRRHDPYLALDGGADGLDAYRALLAAIPGLLAPHGALILELGIGQAPAVAALARAAGLTPRLTVADFAGIPRALLIEPKISATHPAAWLGHLFLAEQRAQPL